MDRTLQILTVKDIIEIISEKKIEHQAEHDFEYNIHNSVLETHQVYASHNEVTRFFSNILNNSISVLKNLKGKINFHLFLYENYLKVETSDNGPGFPMQVMDNQLRNPLSFGKEKGHVLGLYIASKEIQKWSGNIKIFNNNGGVVSLALKSHKDNHDLSSFA